jgi:hypothetical protein
MGIGAKDAARNRTRTVVQPVGLAVARLAGEMELIR